MRSKARPENSLLAEDIDFEQVQAPPPEITQEFTQNLEDIIKQRIRDQVFDDVAPRETGPDKVGEPGDYVSFH